MNTFLIVVGVVLVTLGCIIMATIVLSPTTTPVLVEGLATGLAISVIGITLIVVGVRRLLAARG